MGAGPVSGLMTGSDHLLQRQLFETLVAYGIDWVDTAAGYGEGASERNIGRALEALAPNARAQFRVASKVRVDPHSAVPYREQILHSVEQSLKRLGLSKLTLLQLHNGVTQKTSDEPASVSAEEILKPGGIWEGLLAIKNAGLCDWIGLTGTGHPASLRHLIRQSLFDTIQLPYNILNPSAGTKMPEGFAEKNYDNILTDCKDQRMGVFAIRVLAGGAILQQPPSAHTLRTPYFPIDLYERDRQRASSTLPPSLDQSLGQAIRFALTHEAIHAAIIGFANPQQVDSAVAVLNDDRRTLDTT